jgi:muramoyltetrapeptide carboxypeptidase
MPDTVTTMTTRPLEPNRSTIAIVAPSGPFDREILFPGLAWLRTRYRLQIDTKILAARDGYLAGTDASRAEVFKRAMLDPKVDAIYCARGGYGAMRILDQLPWQEFFKAPKKLIGFSDVTALHVIANARGLATIHGPNATGLGPWLRPIERASVLALLENRPLDPWTGLAIVHRSKHREVKGITAGGNLALIEAMASANRLVIPDGAILFLEDVTERPYRIDRMLTSLRLGGYLQKAAAIVLGGFTQCDPVATDGVTVEQVLMARTEDLGVPVVSGAPFGHALPNRAFPLGAPAKVTIEVSSARVDFL